MNKEQEKNIREEDINPNISGERFEKAESIIGQIKEDFKNKKTFKTIIFSY